MRPRACGRRESWACRAIRPTPPPGRREANRSLRADHDQSRRSGTAPCDEAHRPPALVIVDADTTPRQFGNELRWNAAYHRAVGICLLDPAQVVLPLHSLRIEGVLPVTIAVPQIHRACGQRLLAVGEVLDRHGDGEWHALGLGGAGSEAGRDVTANDAALGEHVGAVGAIARIWAG